MTLDFPILPIINSGDLTHIGMGLASNGWENLLHATKRLFDRPNQPRVREWADWAGRLHIHNPWGLSEPMKFDQHAASLRRAIKLPVDSPHPNTIEQVSNRLNVVEFVAAVKAFPHRLSVYIGSILDHKYIPGESQSSWLWRFLRVLDPYIEAGVKEVGWDNYMGSRESYPKIWNGPNGLPVDAIKAERRLGIEPAIEPFNYVGDEWLHDVTKWITENMLAMMQARNWATRKVDEGQTIQVPGSKGERWVIIAALPQSLTSQQKIDKLNALKQANPTADIAAYALELPPELLN